MSAAGHMLKPGEVVTHNGLMFRIERVERRRVMRVLLELPEETETPESPVTANGVGAAR